MKWYFALSEATLSDSNYVDLVRVALTTALARTTLRPMMLYDGEPNGVTDVLARAGATIVPSRTRFLPQINRRWPDNGHVRRIATGAFLRLEIPRIELEDEFVLYTDCDVQFLSDPKLSAFRPRFFAAAPELDIGDYVKMNSGVLVMNTRGMRAEEAAFTDYVRANFDSFEVFDQTALSFYFAGRYDYLPATLNWKPYWGRSASAEILHFHLKPNQIRAFAAGSREPGLEPLRHLYERTPDDALAMTDRWDAALAAAEAAVPIGPEQREGVRRRDLWPLDFDGEAYLAMYTDVASAGTDPYQHFITWGHLEGRKKPTIEA